MRDRSFSLLFGDWLRDMVGIETLSRGLELIEERTRSLLTGDTEQRQAISLLHERITDLEKIVMALPEVVKSAISTEIEEGTKREELIAQLKARVAELEQRPELKEDEAVVNIKDLVSEIEKINNTPVGDAIVDEVKSNPEIDTPESVENAPETAPDVIQLPEVIIDAIDAIDTAE